MYEVLWTDSDSSPLVTRCHMDSHSPGLQDYSGLLLLLLSDSLCTLSERAGIGKKQKKSQTPVSGLGSVCGKMRRDRALIG